MNSSPHPLPPSWGARLTIVLYGLLPQALTCRLVGLLFDLRLPAFLLRPLILLYGRLAGVDFSEAKLSLDDYPTLGAFFSRELKSNARSFGENVDAVCSPCDGVVIAAGTITELGLWQIKNWRYSAAALFADEDIARHFMGGQYATIFLSPGDYHRFHVPFTSRLCRVDHVPGRLWPVHAPGIHNVRGIYARNERVIGYFHAPGSDAPSCAVVAVGGVAVGKIVVDVARADPHARVHTRKVLDVPLHVAVGDEWGHFAVGSTIVVLLRASAGSLATAFGDRVRAGQPIGTRSSSSARMSA